MIVGTVLGALVGKSATPTASKPATKADHTIREVAAGREVYEQAGTDGPKAADEPVAHIGVVIAAERWQEVGLSKHHPVSPDQHDREEDANDTNDHSSLEERFPEKAVVLTLICWRLYHRGSPTPTVGLTQYEPLFMSAARLTG
jgi:hypothetical protein